MISILKIRMAAYLLLGHSSLLESTPTAVVPDGFTIVTGGKCGYPTIGRYSNLANRRVGPYKLINSFDEAINPVFLVNPDTMGKRLLARKLGPLLIEKAGSAFLDLKYSAVSIFENKDGDYYIMTAGVLAAPFTQDKIKYAVIPKETPLHDVDISSFYMGVVTPHPQHVMEELVRTLLHVDKDVYGITVDVFDMSLEEIMSNPYLAALTNHIMKIPMSQFYRRYYAVFEHSLSVRLSDLLTMLPMPGVVYSLLCRSLPKVVYGHGYINVNANNNGLSEANRSRKKNIIRRQIEEAELGRKHFARLKTMGGKRQTRRRM